MKIWAGQPGVATFTDAQGRFQLALALAPGRHELIVDGRTVPGREFLQVVIGVEVGADTVTALPYAVYLPHVRERDTVRIDSPVARDMVVTHPDIPGRFNQARIER